jgi:AcrR family transcriptional regulator
MKRGKLGAGVAAGFAPRLRKKAGRPSKAERHPRDLERVIDAAIRVFNRHGYEASSMEAVARETGLSKSSLYHHVSSKEELLARALDRAFTPLLATFAEEGALTGSPFERLRYIVNRAVLITLEFAREVELLQRVKGNSRIERDALRRRQTVDHTFQAIVEEAVKAGQLRSGVDASLTTRLLFGLSNSLTQWYRPRGPVGAEAIAQAVTHLVFEGLQAR